jgi:hypothetical protein
MIRAALPNASGVGHANPLLKSKPIGNHSSRKVHICRCNADQPSEVNAATFQQRRRAIASLAAAAAAFSAWQPNNAAVAIQGLTAGRIPGVSGPGTDGFYKYQRPEGKSGRFLRCNNLFWRYKYLFKNNATATTASFTGNKLVVFLFQLLQVAMALAGLKSPATLSRSPPDGTKPLFLLQI